MEIKIESLFRDRTCSWVRAIQGHSGGTLVDPTLQDNVLLPNDFVEYIHHTGNINEKHSIIKSGLIPGGRSLKKDRHFSILYSRESDVHLSVLRRSPVRPG